MKLSGFFILSIIGVSFLINHTTEAQRFVSSVGSTKKEVFYTCLKSKEMRWMRITYQSNGRCKTVYSKNGNATEVAQASSYSVCEETINNVKKNLEMGGYICKEKTLLGELIVN